MSHMYRINPDLYLRSTENSSVYLRSSVTKPRIIIAYITSFITHLLGIIEWRNGGWDQKCIYGPNQIFDSLKLGAQQWKNLYVLPIAYGFTLKFPIFHLNRHICVPFKIICCQILRFRQTINIVSRISRDSFTT